MFNGKHISFWLDDAESTDFPLVKDGTKVDVAIIGGGIVGITTGLMLKKEGLKVAIIESKRIASDITGGTTAKITISPNLIYDYLLTNWGMKIASNFRDASILGFDTIAELVEEYAIDCDYKTVPLYIYSTDKKNLQAIEKEYEAVKKLNIDANLTDLPAPFNKDLEDDTHVINKAIKFNNQAEFHPKKYINALVKLIPGDGSYIFEKTKVLDIEDGKTKRILTENGDVFADSVVVATNSPIHDPNSTLSYMEQIKSYILGVYIKEKFPEGMFVNIDPFHTYRATPTKEGDLIIIAGEHHFTGKVEDTWNCFKNLLEFIDEKFNVESVEYFWSSQDGLPTDRLPIIGETSQKGVYMATGFGSWGMVKGTFAGIILKDLIMNKKNKYIETFSPKRLKKQESVKKSCVTNFNMKDLNEEESKILKDFILKLEYGEAKIVELPNRAVAVYKDSDSSVFGVHANCAHFGCRLKWNSAEKTWDCPQHGSRFDYKGNSIHSPAIRNLKSYLD